MRRWVTCDLLFNLICGTPETHATGNGATLGNLAIGVFTNVDAGLGVDLTVANELGISTSQTHALRQGIAPN